MLNYLQNKEYITLNSFGEITHINNVILSKVLIDEMIEKGFLCTDESDIELRYYYNKILFK